MGFGLPLVSSARSETLGRGTGIGTTITANASANTKGSLTTLGTTNFQYDGIDIDINQFVSNNCGRSRVDITANTGGADQVIAADILSDNTNAGVYTVGRWISLPISVPGGAVIKARVQASIGGGQLNVMVNGYRGSATSLKGFSRLLGCTDWGATTDAANGLTLAGTSLSSWATVQAVTTERIGALYFTFSTGGTTLSSNAWAIFDLGWGASGSERLLRSRAVPNLGQGMPYSYLFAGPMLCDLPAGTRLAVRAQCSTADTNVVYPALYGLAK